MADYALLIILSTENKKHFWFCMQQTFKHIQVLVYYQLTCWIIPYWYCNACCCDRFWLEKQNATLLYAVCKQCRSIFNFHSRQNNDYGNIKKTCVIHLLMFSIIAIQVLMVMKAQVCSLSWISVLLDENRNLPDQLKKVTVLVKAMLYGILMVYAQITGELTGD